MKDRKKGGKEAESPMRHDGATLSPVAGANRSLPDVYGEESNSEKESGRARDERKEKRGSRGTARSPVEAVVGGRRGRPARCPCFIAAGERENNGRAISV